MKRILLALFASLVATAASAALNLNTATKDELVALPGIGPAKAQAIVDYRTTHGGFKSVDELKDVKGIGAKRFEKLKAEVTVGPGGGKAAPAAKGTASRASSGEVVAANGGTKKDAPQAKPKP